MGKKLLYFIIVGLLIMFVAEKVNVYFLKKHQVTYIRFGERILVLPNDYYVDYWGKWELDYRGEKGAVVLSKEMPADSLEYFERNLKKKSEKCGMKMFDGYIHDMKTTLLFEGKMSLLFVDVPPEVETAALTSLCKPRKVKASPSVPGALPAPIKPAQ